MSVATALCFLAVCWAVTANAINANISRKQSSYGQRLIRFLVRTMERLAGRPWRRLSLLPIQFFARGILFCLGFFWIDTTGTPASIDEAVILVANHTSMWEVLYLFYVFGPSALSRVENLKIPGLSAVLQLSESYFTDRSDKTSCKEASVMISKHTERARLDPNRANQLLIFPEGTTTNGSVVCAFKTGAFRPGVAVQPIAIRYDWKFHNPAWTLDNMGIMRNLVGMYLQFVNKMHVTFLPVYSPSEDERRVAKLFAANVQRLIATAINVPTSDMSVSHVMNVIQ